MKKIILLLVSISLFVIAGCADESGSSSGNSETCPISSADFKFDKQYNGYNTILMQANKSVYKDSISWKTDNEVYTKMLPVFKFDEQELQKKPTVTLLYNNHQCGEPLSINAVENQYDKSSTPNPCPISTDDYIFSLIKDTIQIIEFNTALGNEDKKIYENGIMWIASNNRKYNEITPDIYFDDRMSSEDILTITLFYNNMQCGKPYILNSLINN